jgi:AcrR family transcriptional regulator
MLQSRTFQSWIDAGYEVFSREGEEGIQIERLARNLDLNKSGFYHHFGDRRTYIEHLIRQHIQQMDELRTEAGLLKTFDPEFINLLINNKMRVIFHMQLMRYRHIQTYADAYHIGNSKLDEAVLPIWGAYLGLPTQPHLALRYYKMVRDTFFSRVSSDTMNYEFISELVLEAKAITEAFVKNENLSAKATGI